MKCRKFLSMLLAFCLVFSLMSVSSFAEETGSEEAREEVYAAAETAEQPDSVPTESLPEAAEPVSADSAAPELSDTAAPDPVVPAALGQGGAGSIKPLGQGETGTIEPVPEEPVNGTEVTSWSQLQAALNAGGRIKLAGNITAGSGDDALTVPADVTVTLDLNGFTINRNLGNPVLGGFVLKNAGTLTITDSSGDDSGTITGGNNSVNYDEYAGGGICNLGTLTLAGGTISGNRSEDSAGVYNKRGCTFNMTGGVILNNTSVSDGGGIANYGTVNISGGFIMMNSAGTRGGGIYTGGSYASVNISGGNIVENTAGSNGGGIYLNESEAVISGGDIMYNRAVGSSTLEDDRGFGGGIYAYWAEITITGGRISGNTALQCGGAYMCYGTSLTMSGDPRIIVNISNDSSDLYLDDDVKINVNGAFAESADIGVSAAQAPGVTITRGYGAYNTLDPAETFSTIGLDVLRDTSGEVWIGEGRTISLTQSASGVVTLGSTKAYPGTKVSLTAQSGTKPYIPYNNTTIDVTDEGNGVWSFIMPDANVTVDVRYTGVRYIDKKWWNDAQVIPEIGYAEAAPVPADGKMTSGWYYLNSNVTKDGRIESITGDVNLILGDGCTLDVKGLYVPPDTTLTIYGQSEGTDAGRLYSHPSGGAAIGGYSGHDNGKIVIKGGTIDAYGYDNCAAIGKNSGQKGGDITIYGGIITAVGGKNGAGIGGGRDCYGGNITIYDGWIEATGGDDAAGIGGGENGDGGNITIYRATIRANLEPNENAAAIGGGNNGDGGNITINGGLIIVDNRDGAGIGGGEDGDGGNITINGGEIHCLYQGQGNGAGIGGGNHGGAGGTIIINNGDITIRSGHGAGIGGGRSEGGFAAEIVHDSGDGGNITIRDGVLKITSEHSFAIGAGAGPGDGNPDGNNTGASGTIRIYGGDLTLKGHAARVNDSTFERTGGIGGDTGQFEMYGGTISCPENSHILWNIGNGSILIEGGTLDGGMIETDETVVINGGTLHLKKTKSDKPCIYADDYVRIADCIMVQEGTERTAQSPVQENKRLSVLTDKNNTKTFFTISVCDHRDLDYIIDKDGVPFTHTAHCGYCATAFETERHTYNEVGVCTVCGYKGTPYLVTFHPENGMDNHTEVVMKGETVSRPEEDPVRIGYRFLGWYQVLEEMADEPFDFDNTAIYGNTDLKAKWEEIREVIINGVSGTFDDSIKLNFYLDLPEILRAQANAYVLLTNENTGRSIRISTRTAAWVPGRGYKFSIPLAAKEAGDTITAKVYNNAGQQIVIKGPSGTIYPQTGVAYSLMEYFTWLEGNGTADEKAVGAAAKDYCSAAMIYFNYNADGAAVSSAVDAVKAEDLSRYIASRDGTLPEGVTIRGISAMLESDNTLRLYLGFKNVDPSAYTYRINGRIVQLRQRSDGAYYLTMDSGVYSNQLQTVHHYQISDGTNFYDIFASVLTYARSCAIKNSKVESDLGKALYLYNRAAVAAFGE